MAYWVYSGEANSKVFDSKLEAYEHLVSILKIDGTIECKVIERKIMKKGK